MPIRQGVSFAIAAEQMGFHRVFVGEDILSREVFTYLSVIALKTSKIGLATGITSAYVRNPAVLASSVLSLQKVSGNRFDLGLGVGGIPEVEKLTESAPRQPVRVLGGTAATIRRLLRGETISDTDLNGNVRMSGFKLRNVDVKMPQILFGVRGPRLLALAGEVADGVIFSGSKALLQESLRIVAEAAVKAGRCLDNLEKVLWLPFVETKDAEDLNLARLVVATVIASLPQPQILEIPALAETLKEVLPRLQSGDYEAASLFLSREALQEFCFFGTIEEMMKEARKFADLGFKEFVIGPPFGRRPEETLKALRHIASIPEAEMQKLHEHADNSHG
jgi:5,10-methylenetetrahydromethanopterin reductase